MCGECTIHKSLEMHRLWSLDNAEEKEQFEVLDFDGG
jgi:hypothetical protein